MCDPGDVPAGWEQKAALCTFKLHHSLCQARKQAVDRGLTAYNMELWLERYLVWRASQPKYRVHSAPEQIIAQQYLQICAVGQFELRVGHSLPSMAQVRDGTFSLFAAGSGTAHHRSSSSAYDVGNNTFDSSSGSGDGDGGGNTPGSNNSHNSMTMGGNGSSSGGWLTGQGRRIDQDAAWSIDLQRCVIRCLKANEQWEQWDEVWLDAQVWLHKQAILESQQQINSTAYERNRSREGTFFLLYFESGEGSIVRHTPHAMQAEYFLRLVHPTHPSQVARLVIARPCRLSPISQDPDLADLVLQGPTGEFAGPSCAVLLDLVQGPLAQARRNEQHGSGTRSMTMYLPMLFRSGAAGLRVQRRLPEATASGATQQQQQRRRRRKRSSSPDAEV
jgi:hypothetical protein